MATNLAIDPDLIERALELSGERTKKAAVTKALLSSGHWRCAATGRRTSRRSGGFGMCCWRNCASGTN